VDDAERQASGAHGGVEVAQAERELVDDVKRERLGHGAVEVTREIGAVDVLHHDVVAAVVHAEAEHGDEVTVVQRGAERGLADQRALELGLAGELGSELLDRDQALEAARAVGAREVDLGHSAAAEPAYQRVGADRAYHEAWSGTRQCTAISSTEAAVGCAASWSRSTAPTVAAPAGSARPRS
jgi:hypothetical protein